MKFLSFLLLLFFTKPLCAIIEQDDRFYTEGTPWEEVFNGVLRLDHIGCTGFVTTDNVVVTAAHCLGALLNKEYLIDYKRLQNFTVRFGNANLDPNDLQSNFDHRSKSYAVKEVYIPPDYFSGASYIKGAVDDYAFLKLKKEIPDHINKFELFRPEMLEDYKIIRTSDGGSFNLIGYHGDNSKTKLQKQVQIGCQSKDQLNYKGVWVYHHDCDSVGGSSGGPVFYILRHKETKKIKLAYIGTHSRGNVNLSNRHFDSVTGKYQLQQGIGYDFSWKLNDKEAFRQEQVAASATSASSTNKQFIKIYEQFKENPSYFKDGKNLRLNEKLQRTLENIVNYKNNEQFKQFLHENSDESYYMIQKLNQLKVQGKLSEEKDKIYLEYVKKYKEDYQKNLKNQKRFKKIKYPKKLSIKEAYRRLEELKSYPIYESEIGNKDKALEKFKDVFQPCKNKESKECKKFQKSQNELKEKVCKIPEKVKKTCKNLDLESCFKKVHQCMNLRKQIKEDVSSNIDFVVEDKAIPESDPEKFKQRLSQCNTFNEKHFNKYLNQKKSYEDDLKKLNKQKFRILQSFYNLEPEVSLLLKNLSRKRDEIIELKKEFDSKNVKSGNEKKGSEIANLTIFLLELEKTLIFHKQSHLFHDENDKKSSIRSEILKKCGDPDYIKKIFTDQFQKNTPIKLADFSKEKLWHPRNLYKRLVSIKYHCLSQAYIRNSLKEDVYVPALRELLSIGDFVRKQKDQVKKIKRKIVVLRKKINQKRNLLNKDLRKDFDHYQSLKKEKEDQFKKQAYRASQKIQALSHNKDRGLEAESMIYATKISKEALKATLLQDLNQTKDLRDFFLDRYTIDQSRDPVKVKLKGFVKKYKCEPELSDPKNWKWNQVDFPQKGMNDESIIRPRQKNSSGIR